jgi:hypothetical protein
LDYLLAYLFCKQVTLAATIRRAPPLCPALPRYFCGTLRGTAGEVFHAVGDNIRQLHYLLAQSGVLRNVALNAVAIGL